MRREELSDLAVFLAVAEARSFTRAAAVLGTSQSAISQIVRRLEASLGLKLLSRTTRNVGVTEAGERLLETLSPALADIDARLAELSQLREQPSGTVRITCSQHAAETVLWPAVEAVMARYPDVHIELSIDSALTNIVSERFDGGVRLGEQVEKDMIAVRIGPDLQMLVVGAPAYFERHGRPLTPRDLTMHYCINLRMATRGDLYAWEFERDGHPLNVRVGGRLVVNHGEMAIRAALAGLGLAFVMTDRIAVELDSGALVPVLEEWSPPFSGYHLYYPDRRNLTLGFRALLDELRSRAS
ncbi:LysR family transcriptional regulator [Novosphingobium sp. PASSN1]|uniref:LysR family transcriptional regulator n=1 Tax=Novosphingobium sp. PASSN1 TaxID=2015561 RepID=UPI000BC656F7|nr:LysR family transcriptional regulator [Novosphingobium sp. PASSN1]OYU35270.1 MAG: LysR family transcriptional regulator [Novosphingobium sp. PASSN1]